MIETINLVLPNARLHSPMGEGKHNDLMKWKSSGTYLDCGPSTWCSGLPVEATLPESVRKDTGPSSARFEPTGSWPCVDTDCSRLAASLSSSGRRAGSHVPMSDGLRRDWSLAILLAASMKMLSGLRSPTNREADSSMSWEATSRADDAPEVFCSGDSGELGRVPGRFDEPPWPSGCCGSGLRWA